MNELYAQHFEELARFCTVLYHDAEKGADLAQETFLRALEHADRLTAFSPQEQRAWLYRTAKNLFLDETRRNARFLKRQQLLFVPCHHTMLVLLVAEDPLGSYNILIRTWN